MKYIRGLVHSFLVLGALASQCSEVKEFNKNIEGDIDLTCNRNGNITKFNLTRLSLNQEYVNILSGLSGLEEIEFTECDFEDDLDYSSLKNLKNLKKLTTNRVGSTLNAFKNVESLRSLVLYGNTSIDDEDIEIISGFNELESLKIDVRSIYAEDFSSLKNLKNLSELEIEDGCDKVPEELKSLCSSNSVPTETISEAYVEYEESSLEEFENVTSLEKIKLMRISLSQRGIDILSSLSGLEEIEFTECDFEDDLDYSSLRNLKNLKKLTTNRVGSTLNAFKNVEFLRSLVLYGNTSIDDEDIEIISGFNELESLKIDVRSIYAEDFSPLKNLKNLSELEIEDGCDKVPEELKSLCSSNSVSTESISEAYAEYEESSLEEFENVITIEKIKLMRISLSQRGIDILSSLSGLEEIEFTECDFEDDLDYSPLRNLKNLKKLTTNRVGSTLNAFKNVKSLRSLVLYGNTSINDEDVEIISGFNELESLKIDVRSIYAEDFSPLKNLKNLSELEIEDGCDKVPEELKSLCSSNSVPTETISEAYVEYEESSLEEFENVTSLEKIKLMRISLSQKGIDILSSLSGLEEIEFTECEFDDDLDYSSLKNLKNLKKLTTNRVGSTLNAFKNVESLRSLVLYGNTSIDDEDIEIISGFSELESLIIDVRSIDAEDLSSLKNLKNLSELEIEDGCDKVPEELKSLCSSNSVSTESISEAYAEYEESSLEEFENVITIEKIKLMRISLSQRGIDILSSLSGLEEIEFTECDFEDDLDYSSLRNLKNLKKLTTNRVGSTLNAFKNVKSLRSLVLYGNTSIDDEDIEIISGFNELESLKIDVHFIDAEDFSPLKNLKNLSEIDIEDGCDKVPEELKSLCSSNSVPTETIKEFENVTSLEKIKLMRISLSQKGIDILSSLSGLEEIEFTECDFEDDLDYSSLRNLKNLKKLTTNRVGSTLNAFKNVEFLRSLVLYGNTSINDEDIEIISGFNELESLKIDVRSIYAEDFSPLKNLKNLSELEIEDGCDKVPEELKSLCSSN
ncbi:RNI-like protein [Neocallimastix sp. 'constans']